METVLALDALLLMGMGGSGIAAAIAGGRLLRATTPRGRQTLALVASTTLSLATALALLRLVVASGWLPLLGVEGAAELAPTVPLTLVPVLAAFAVGPRLRALAGRAIEADEWDEQPDPVPTIVDRALVLPVLLSGAAAALAVALWAFRPEPTAGLVLAGIGAAVVAVALQQRRRARVAHRQSPVASPSPVPVAP